MSNVTKYTRLVAGCVVPHTLVEVLRAHRTRKRLATEGQRRREILDALCSKSRGPAISYSWSDALDFLAALDNDRSDIIAGTIPERSLEYACRELGLRIKARTVLGLHIGNFVGISLCHFTNFVRRLDEKSTIVSIDPNLPVRSIQNPMEKVIRCLNRYNLQGNSMILTGYSLEKSGNNTPEYEKAFDQEFSCENQLPQLRAAYAWLFRLCSPRRQP